MALYPEIFNGVTAQLAQLSAGVTCWFGPDNLHRQEAPPRIVWEPTGDAYGPPSQRGSSRSDSVARHTCRCAVDIHVWGAGWAEAVALKDQFIDAMRLFLGSNYHLVGGRWVGSADIESAGKIYVLSFFIDIPVVDLPTSTVVVTATTQTDVAFQH
jgi:hypothetical protein